MIDMVFIMATTLWVLLFSLLLYKNYSSKPQIQKIKGNADKDQAVFPKEFAQTVASIYADRKESKGRLNIVKITVMLTNDDDEVFLYTDKPCSFFGEENLAIKFSTKKNCGVEYCRKNFNIDPKVIEIR